jgi:hypothetical protein
MQTGCTQPGWHPMVPIWFMLATAEVLELMLLTRLGYLLVEDSIDHRRLQYQRIWYQFRTSTD